MTVYQCTPIRFGSARERTCHVDYVYRTFDVEEVVEYEVDGAYVVAVVHHGQIAEQRQSEESTRAIE